MWGVVVVVCGLFFLFFLLIFIVAKGPFQFHYENLIFKLELVEINFWKD